MPLTPDRLLEKRWRNEDKKAHPACLLYTSGQGRMIQVSIPASVPLKEFDYNAEVELINPVADLSLIHI